MGQSTFSNKKGIMKNLLFTSLMLVMLATPTAAQGTSYANQDCVGATALCFSRYNVPVTFQGFGQQEELRDYYDNNFNFCLLNGENNSVWFKFEVGAAGTVVFTIEPLGQNDDYDFAVFNVTDLTCAEVASSTAPFVRCNYALTQGSSTGLAVGSTSTSASPNGDAFLAPLAVDSGELFYIVIDNFTNNGVGFNLDFTGSTATTSYCDSLRFVTTAIGQIETAQQFDLYPNPTTGTVNVTVPYTAQLIEMVDISGKLVKRFEGAAKGEQIQLDVASVPQGLYLIKVIHAKGIATQKLQVLH